MLDSDHFSLWQRVMVWRTELEELEGAFFRGFEVFKYLLGR